jgi:hypothetical protein
MTYIFGNLRHRARKIGIQIMNIGVGPEISGSDWVGTCQGNFLGNLAFLHKNKIPYNTILRTFNKMQLFDVRPTQGAQGTPKIGGL